MKTLLKRRLSILSNFFTIIPSRLVTKKKGIYVGVEERGPRLSLDRCGRICRLAVPVLKLTYSLAISQCSCTGTANKFTKKPDVRAELLFCPFNLWLFWRFRCRRRRSFVRSLMTVPDLVFTAVRCWTVWDAILLTLTNLCPRCHFKLVRKRSKICSGNIRCKIALDDVKIDTLNVTLLFAGIVRCFFILLVPLRVLLI